ncbi:hypothetical protein QBC46DRAFT_447589 [Diplogelasinospora grovesii]|uniref:Protein kinase domain-containing protein n=1 Tax=Diplogelasinospora grovesii TaxID=303347 RepID=A0AAN6S6U8_9PEZI|nr:hypothetical protein QBC46DRAFT_447589 [Diplogelasinospora grovesii]
MSSDIPPSWLRATPPQNPGWKLMCAWDEPNVGGVGFIATMKAGLPPTPSLFYGTIKDFPFKACPPNSLKSQILADIGRAEVYAIPNEDVYPIVPTYTSFPTYATLGPLENRPARPAGTMVKTPAVRFLPVPQSQDDVQVNIDVVKDSFDREKQAFSNWANQFRQNRNIISGYLYTSEIRDGFVKGLVYDDIRLDGVRVENSERVEVSPVPRPYTRVDGNQGWLWRHDAAVRPDCDLATLRALEPEVLRSLVDKDLFRKRTIIRGVENAFRYLHIQGCAHNNIRPEHVLITLDTRYRPEAKTEFYWPVLTGFKACKILGLEVDFIDSDGRYKKLHSSVSNDEKAMSELEACVDEILEKL